MEYMDILGKIRWIYMNVYEITLIYRGKHMTNNGFFGGKHMTNWCKNWWKMRGTSPVFSSGSVFRKMVEENRWGNQFFHQQTEPFVNMHWPILDWRRLGFILNILNQIVFMKMRSGFTMIYPSTSRSKDRTCLSNGYKMFMCRGQNMEKTSLQKWKRRFINFRPNLNIWSNMIQLTTQTGRFAQEYASCSWLGPKQCSRKSLVGNPSHGNLSG